MKKKVLIVSYYWPPAGGISPLRILKFVKYLRRYDWEPVVVIPENAQYPVYDPSYARDIPPELEIHKVPIIEPFELYKKLAGRKKNDAQNPVYGNDTKKSWIDPLAIWIRGNFFIPDARALWIKPTVKYISRYLRNHSVDAILTDGPPHTNTVIGMRIARKFHIPWLADFQDPWTQVDYYSKFKLTPWADRKHRKLEQEVFRTADKITIASPTWAKDLESIGARNVDVIYYGYDEDDFRDIQPVHNPALFTVTHTGILGEDRKPDKLFKILKELTEEIPDFARKLKIIFAGKVDTSIGQSIRKYGLETFYEEPGQLPRKEALQLNASADILLLPVNKAPNAKGRLPGKLYEYLRIGKPILALGPVDSDAASIIRETGAGETFAYEDEENIKKFIRDIYLKRRIYQPKNIEKFSNLHQTEKLAGYLNQIIKK